ncbi:MAG: hypothetical protein JXQ65_09710 [Candidatus Marinimicrobia bacterium]|nr:hypothetical protein [Candidatus Neomarinimicrobiota bacterium]
MSEKWNEFKQKIGKFAAGAADKATEFTKDTANKAERLTQKSKIKLDIYQLEKSKEKEFQKLGKIAFDLRDKGLDEIMNNEESSNAIGEIIKLNDLIKIKEETLQNLSQKV